MGTRTLFKLAAGLLCIVSTVSAQFQYPYNSLPRGPEKNNARLRPQFSNPAYPSPSPPQAEEPAKFAKIMKQINKVNDDGSYSFGFENDDGSFRVETRTKDGIVKGKYGFIDANGQLKVTEYTAGEKSDDPSDEETTESEEEGGDFKRPRIAQRPVPTVSNRPLPLSARPHQYASQSPAYQPRAHVPQYVPRQLSSGSQQVASATAAPYRIGSRSDVFDQAPAAQTQQKVSREPPTTESDFKESAEEDSDSFSKRQSGSQENLNGQYFRQSVTPTQSGGRFPGVSGGGSASGGRPLYGGGNNGPSAYAQQYPLGFGGPSGPGPVSPGPYNFPQGNPQGGFIGGGARGQQGFPSQGFPAGDNPFDIPNGFVGNPDFSTFPIPQRGAASPQLQGQFRPIQSPPQDFSSIGRPYISQQGQRSPADLQSIQNFGGFGGFNQRQGPGGAAAANKGNENQEIPNEERYVPSVELDGFSEDVNEDGYVDELPNNGASKGQNSNQIKSGPTGAYRPSALGPQSGAHLQGGAGPQRPPPGQVILQLGPQGGASPNALGLGAGGRFPQQQRPAGIIQQQGGNGLPPQYIPQQSFGGFPQDGFQYPQAFPQGFGGPGQYNPQQQYNPFNPQAAQGQYTGNEGFPYDYSPFPNGQGGFQGGQGGFPGGQGGFPIGAAQFPQGNYPGEGVQNFGFPSSGPGRFPSSGSGSPQSQSFSGSQFGGLGQGSPTPGGAQSSSIEEKKP